MANPQKKKIFITKAQKKYMVVGGVLFAAIVIISGVTSSYTNKMKTQRQEKNEQVVQKNVKTTDFARPDNFINDESLWKTTEGAKVEEQQRKIEALERKIDINLRSAKNMDKGLPGGDVFGNGMSIQEIAGTNGIMFFFRSDCSYCHAMAPILRNFADQYGIRVLAVSLDGGGIQGFENYDVDNGISSKLGVTVVPSIFVMDTKTKQFKPISNGVISQVELENRFLVITKDVGSIY